MKTYVLMTETQASHPEPSGRFAPFISLQLVLPELLRTCKDCGELILVCGANASGKTSLLMACLGAWPHLLEPCDISNTLSQIASVRLCQFGASKVSWQSPKVSLQSHLGSLASRRRSSQKRDVAEVHSLWLIPLPEFTDSMSRLGGMACEDPVLLDGTIEENVYYNVASFEGSSDFLMQALLAEWHLPEQSSVRMLNNSGTDFYSHSSRESQALQQSPKTGEISKQIIDSRPRWMAFDMK
eukprot:330841-Amphidinium_carterae.1